MKLKDAPWKKNYDQPRQHIKNQRHYFADKGQSSQSCGFSGGHVWMWELDYKDSWALKNWCFWTAVLEKTLESPLYFKEIKSVNLKRNQPWIFIRRTDAKAETPILWPADMKSWLLGRDPDARKEWEQEKGAIKDEMLDGIIDSTDMNFNKLWEIVTDREARRAAVHEVAKSRTWLRNSTTTLEWHSIMLNCVPTMYQTLF